MFNLNLITRKQYDNPDSRKSQTVLDSCQEKQRLGGRQHKVDYYRLREIKYNQMQGMNPDSQKRATKDTLG